MLTISQLGIEFFEKNLSYSFVFVVIVMLKNVGTMIQLPETVHHTVRSHHVVVSPAAGKGFL